MAKLMLSLVLCACAFVQSAFGFAKYVDITIQNYTGNEVANFPVLVKIDGIKIPGIYDDVKNNGADLSFTDVSNKAEYPYDVDVWDPTGTSLVWVKVPSLADGATLRMHYGDAAKTENDSASDVWAGYACVFHLSTGLDDSVEGGTTAVAVSPTAPLAAGAIGAGYKISPESVTSGSKAGAIYCPGTVSVDYSAGFTLSLWMNNVSASSWDEGQVLFATAKGVWERNDGFFIYAGWPLDGKEVWFGTGAGASKFYHKSAPPLWDNNKWHLYTLIYDGSTVKSYVDGIYGGTTLTTSVTANDEPLTLGSYSNSDVSKIGTADSEGYSWKGGVDECRFTTALKSVDWLRAEYLVVNNDVTKFGEPQSDTPAVDVLPQGVTVY